MRGIRFVSSLMLRWRRHRLGLTTALAGVVSLAVIFWVVWIVSQASEGILEILTSYAKTGGGELAAGFLLRCAAIGLLTMALIQIVRGIIPVRGRFHREEVQDWLEEGYAHLLEGLSAGERRLELNESNGGKDDTANGSKDEISEMVVGQLVEHAVTSGRSEIFDLPLERLCGQIGAAAELVLREPSGKRLLLAGLAGTKAAKEYLASSENDRSASVMARNLIEQRIQRNIDGLQIRAGLRWRRRLRFLSILVSAVLAMGLMWQVDSRDAGWYLSLTVTSLVAGYLAGVARDVVAVIEKLRG